MVLPLVSTAVTWIVSTFAPPSIVTHSLTKNGDGDHGLYAYTEIQSVIWPG